MEVNKSVNKAEILSDEIKEEVDISDGVVENAPVADDGDMHNAHQYNFLNNPNSWERGAVLDSVRSFKSKSLTLHYIYLCNLHCQAQPKLNFNRIRLKLSLIPQ